jgi:hypothetical protein
MRTRAIGAGDPVVTKRGLILYARVLGGGAMSGLSLAPPNRQVSWGRSGRRQVVDHRVDSRPDHAEPPPDSSRARTGWGEVSSRDGAPIPGQLDVDEVLDLVVRDERHPEPVASAASWSRRSRSWSRPSRRSGWQAADAAHLPASVRAPRGLHQRQPGPQPGGVALASTPARSGLPSAPLSRSLPHRVEIAVPRGVDAPRGPGTDSSRDQSGRVLPGSFSWTTRAYARPRASDRFPARCRRFVRWRAHS